MDGAGGRARTDTSLSALRGSSFLYTYLQVRAVDDIATIQAAMPAFVDRHAHGSDGDRYAHKEYQYRLLPLAEIHLSDGRTGAAFKPGADPLFVRVLGVVGAVTLLIAIVNYVSLAAARAGLRAARSRCARSWGRRATL